MSKAVTNPLQLLIKKAAASLPVSTGKVALHQEKINRRQGETVILADISISMDSIAWGGQRKIDILRSAVRLAREARDARLFVFSAETREVEDIPDSTEANTALHTALERVAALDPGVTLVICDGVPDDRARALEAAKKFRGVIDVLYIGPESDTQAIAFMRKLASVAGGDIRTYDVLMLGDAQQMRAQIAGLLQ